MQEGKVTLNVLWEKPLRKTFSTVVKSFVFRTGALSDNADKC
jgi:hypothetical protein